MKLLFRILIASLLLVMLTLLFPMPSLACSCAEMSPVEDELARSVAVFYGRVLEINEESYPKKVLFDVKEIWKGTDQSQIIIQTGLGGGDCGIDFQVGQEYLVYANDSHLYGDEYLSTGICDRTISTLTSNEDFEILGQGMVPTVELNLENELNEIFPTWIIVGFCIVIGAIGFSVYWVFSRMKRKQS
ncbi:hypothetical protein [Paucisalibacillus globulus]|uniref:hypothetical protein n=1 Tax=Paucisalibacillus globulus TaxID=351095 RepID=UPI000412FA23|nr:hypothetical protein [Paucisalibacillus globulus]